MGPLIRWRWKRITLILRSIDNPINEWYDRGMKIKTSITISEELLKLIDEFVDEGQSRSLFLEAAAREYIVRLRRARQNLRDLELINEHAAYLNDEVMDALDYQVAL